MGTQKLSMMAEAVSSPQSPVSGNSGFETRNRKRPSVQRDGQRLSKGQSSFEMFVTVGAFLLFILPIILILLALSQAGLENLSLMSGHSTVQRLSDSINEVYLQGDGARRSILLDLPPNSKSLAVGNHSAVLYLSTSSGQYEISHPVFANVSDFSTTKSGLVDLMIMCNGTTVMLK